MKIDNFYKYECNVYKYQLRYLIIIIGIIINLMFYLYFY